MHDQTGTSPIGTSQWFDFIPYGTNSVLCVGANADALGKALRQREPDRPIADADWHSNPISFSADQSDTESLDANELDATGIGVIVVDQLRIDDSVEYLHHWCKRLSSNGIVLAKFENNQHYVHLLKMLHGDISQSELRRIEHTNWSTAFSCFLDVGLAPRLADFTTDPCPPQLLYALAPALFHLGIHPDRMRRYLSVREFVIIGTPYPFHKATHREPAVVACCVSDSSALSTNLLASPELAALDSPRLVTAFAKSSIAEGINPILDKHPNQWVIVAHQDIYLPRGWFDRFFTSVRESRIRFGDSPVYGVYGTARSDQTVLRIGRVIDRDRPLLEPTVLPHPADSLDELLLAFPPGSPLRLDPAMGFHLYGTDLALTASAGGRPAVVVDALCFHNSRSVGLPPEFRFSVQALQRKWSTRLPIWTPCVRIDGDGTFQEWLTNKFDRPADFDH